MRRHIIITGILILSILMVGCKKKVQKTQEVQETQELQDLQEVQELREAQEAPEPVWHTAVAWPVVATITMTNGQSLSSNCKAQSVRDSLTIISLMPIAGIEIMRLEARPDSVFVIDRINRRCAADSYATLSTMVGETLSLRMVEAIVAGEILEEGRQDFEFEAMGMRLHLKYPIVQHDGIIRIQQIDKTRFTPCTFYELLY